jgi:hypothetical protein
MPMHIEWDRADHTVIRHTFEGQWTLDEFIVSNDRLLKMIRAEPHTVHVIGDMTQTKSAPQRLLSISRYLENNMADNVGLIVLVDPGYFIQALINIASRLMPRFVATLRYAKTLEEAHALIDKAQAVSESN